MFENFLFILQILTTPVDYAAIAISATTPIGLATAVYANQNGLRFFPWLVAGMVAPGISLIPLRKKIALELEKKAQHRVNHLLQHGETLTLNQMKDTAEVDLNDTLYGQTKTILTDQAPFQKDQNSLQATAHYDEGKSIDIQTTDSGNEDLALQLKWINEENTDQQFIRFMDMDPEVFKEGESSPVNTQKAQLQHFLEYLDGVWLHFDKERKMLKKAFFSGEKFGLLTSKKVNNISTQYADFEFQGHICLLKLSDRNLPIRVVSADIIFLNGERFVRYKKTATA